MIFDYVIVGGGSAGCVLANRLSARSTNKVLLCEAGPDLPEGAIPPDILDSYPGKAYSDPAHQWAGLKARKQPMPHNGPHNGPHNAPGDSPAPPAAGYVQARILGGGSTINGQMANRGAPSDYNEWQALGAEGWDWQSVLPYFNKVERDLDFDGPYHGKDGKIPIRRIFPKDWNGHARAAAKAFEELGFRYLPDQNGPFEIGYFPLTHANADERRVSASMAYLDAEVRQRSNLTIATGAHVTGLLIDGKKCTGIRARVKGQELEFKANEVILSAGAIHSPAILMRAGIGPIGQLRAFGIEVVAALPGVGAGLMDHPQVALGAFLHRAARMNDVTRRHVLIGLRYSSGLGGAPEGDMFIGCLDRTAWHPIGGQIGSLVVWVNKSYSKGEVRLESPDWNQEPAIDLNLLSDSRDLDRLKSGFRMMAAIQATQAMQAASSMPFPANYTDKMRQIGVDNAKNRFLTTMMAYLLDGPAVLRRFLFKQFVLQGYTFDDLMRSDEALGAFVRQSVGTTFHASCTARMGADSDPMAVTNAGGLVKGIGGLRVADASLFPSVPCANTNLPTLMVAEKIADTILEHFPIRMHRTLRRQDNFGIRLG